MFFTSRAASIVCWPSRTSMPELLQLEHQRRLDDVEAERHVAHALRVEHRLDLARRVAKQRDCRRRPRRASRGARRGNGRCAATARSSWWCLAAEPKSQM